MPASSTVAVLAQTITAFGVSLEIAVLVVLFLVLFFFSFISEKGRSVAFLFSLYPAMLLAEFFPFGASLTPVLSADLHKLGVFLTGLFLSAFLLRNLFSSDFSFGSIRRLVERALISACTLALGLVALFHVALPEAFPGLIGFFKLTSPFLTSPTISFLLLLSPLLGAFIFGRRAFY